MTQVLVAFEQVLNLLQDQGTPDSIDCLSQPSFPF